MRDDNKTKTNVKSTVNKDPMADYVVTEFERYEGFHAKRFEEMEEVYDLWLGTRKTPKQSWMNNVHIPMMFEGEQTITPRMFVALFPTDAPVDVKVEGEAAEQQGTKIKGTIQHYFRVSDVQGESLPMLTQNTVFGTGYCEAGLWYTKFGWQMDSETGERYWTPIENRPDCKFVNFFEMFPHPSKLRIGDGLPLIRRRYADAEFLKRMKNNPFFDTKKIDEALQTELPTQGQHKSHNKKKTDEYEILEYFGPYEKQTTGNADVTTKELVPHWIIVINREVTIRGIANPFNHQMEPFCKITMFPDAKPNWFGIGVGKIGKGSNDRLNKVVNQRLDNVDLVLNKQYLVMAGDNYLNRRKLALSQPGAIHDCADTVASVRELVTQDVTGSSYKEEEIAKLDFRESTGATAQLMPTESQHRTALGIQLLQGAAGMRFRPILRKIEIDFIQQLSMFYFSNLKQFMTQAEWVQITGEAGDEAIQVSPEDIQAKAYFIPTGISETQNKEVEITNLLKYKEVTRDDPTVNRAEINKRIGELLGFKDFNKFIVQQQQPTQGSSLSPEVQQKIKQRIAEGASSDQIKQELIGTPPGPGDNVGRGQ